MAFLRPAGRPTYRRLSRAQAQPSVDPFPRERKPCRRPAEEGTTLCIELMQRIREIPGVAGIHVMAYRREHQVSEIVLRSGVRGGGRIG